MYQIEIVCNKNNWINQRQLFDLWQLSRRMYVTNSRQSTNWPNDWWISNASVSFFKVQILTNYSLHSIRVCCRRLFGRYVKSRNGPWRWVFFLNVMMASGRALWMFSLAALYALEQQPRRKKGEKNLSTTEKKRVQCILSVVNQMVTLNSPGLHRAAVYTRCYSIYSIFFSCFVSDHDASLSIRPIHRGASCSLALPFPLWVAS